MSVQGFLHKFFPVSPITALYHHWPFITTKTKIGTLMLTELSSLFRFYEFFLSVFSAPESHTGYHLTLSLCLPDLF